MRIRTANNRRRKRPFSGRRAIKWLKRQAVVSTQPYDWEVDEEPIVNAKARHVECKQCGLSKPYFQVRPDGICFDCD